MLWVCPAPLPRTPPSERQSELETDHLQACAETYVQCSGIYNRTALIRIANYSDRLGPSGKHFVTVIVLHLFMA